MIIGIGVDLVETHRMQTFINKPHRLAKLFTSDELAYAQQSKTPEQHLAACFAVKEAVAKAFGTGLLGHSLTDVAVGHQDNGKPYLILENQAAIKAQQMGIKAWQLSISHTTDHAIAFVVAEG